MPLYMSLYRGPGSGWLGHNKWLVEAMNQVPEGVHIYMVPQQSTGRFWVVATKPQDLLAQHKDWLPAVKCSSTKENKAAATTAEVQLRRGNTVTVVTRGDASLLSQGSTTTASSTSTPASTNLTPSLTKAAVCGMTLLCTELLAAAAEHQDTWWGIFITRKVLQQACRWLQGAKHSALLGREGRKLAQRALLTHANVTNASWVKKGIDDFPLSLVLSLPEPTTKPKQGAAPATLTPAAPSQLSRSRTAQRSVPRSQLPPCKPLAKRAIRHQLRGRGSKRWGSLSAGTAWSLTEPSLTQSLSQNLSAACACSPPASLEATAAC